MTMDTPILGAGDLRLFWTAFDPLDLASDSIDPLGFMTGYVALADRLLPGLTTITTVPRYAGMLCCALSAARNAVGGEISQGPSAYRRQIIEKLKLFERAWALACGIAESNNVGDRATDGLRGVRAVHRYLELVSGKEKISLAFSLLSNQVRYGGIGAYGTFLESMHLADLNALTLRPLGIELARAFPSPESHGLDVLREDGKLSVESLRQWGEFSHVGTLSTPEAQCLRRALQGDEEAELDDQARWVMLRLVRTCAVAEDMAERDLMRACLSFLEHNDFSRIDIGGLAKTRIQPALRVIEQYERMYQCASFLFDQMRTAATSSGRASLTELAGRERVQNAFGEMKVSAADFLREVEAASPEDGIGPARQTLQKLRILDLAQTAASIDNPVMLCQEVVRRHTSIQQGKFDGGLPKGAWISADGNDHQFRLTQQRFGIEPSEAPEAWHNVPRHPYRTAGARRFIRQCLIR
jgi:hypothetical protein